VPRTSGLMCSVPTAACPLANTPARGVPAAATSPISRTPPGATSPTSERSRESTRRPSGPGQRRPSVREAPGRPGTVVGHPAAVPRQRHVARGVKLASRDCVAASSYGKAAISARPARAPLAVEPGTLATPPDCQTRRAGVTLRPAHDGRRRPAFVVARAPRQRLHGPCNALVPRLLNPSRRRPQIPPCIVRQVQTLRPRVVPAPRRSEVVRA
jgi:hypothetical protein